MNGLRHSLPILSLVLSASLLAQTAAPVAQAPAPAAQAPAPAAPPVPGATNSPVVTPPVLQSRPDQPPIDNTVRTIRVTVPEVNLIFSVSDKSGRFVTGLKQQNFGLLDDGRPPDAVINFRQQTNLPLRVGIMLDTSNSIRQKFQFEQDAATEFFLQVLHHDDSAFIEGFDTRVDLEQDYTNNIDLLGQAVHKLHPGGGTAFFDALYTTCRDQMLTLQNTTDVRKAIILVTDGHDNYSHAQEQDAIKMCQRADTAVYAISTNNGPSRDDADTVLQRITDATGGRVVFPNRIEDVANGFKTIEEELRSQYLLRYRPANFQSNGAFRTIYLQALDPRYKVRAHKGYFAPRAPQ